MRTFILRARKVATKPERLRGQIASKSHIEALLHSVLNAFFISSDFRCDVEFYIVLDSSEDFPRSIRLCSAEGLSLTGFHEGAVLELMERALRQSQGIKQGECLDIEPGLQVLGYGFERLVSHCLAAGRPLYLLDKKGESMREQRIEPNPVFLLSDHLVMPKKTVAGLKRKGLKSLSLGRRLLFASQCVVLIHNELDWQGEL